MPQHASTQKSRGKPLNNRSSQDAILEESLLKKETVQRIRSRPSEVSPADVLQLQRAVGNQQVARLLGRQNPSPVGAQPTQIQRSLAVGPAHDVYEREADHIAKVVSSAPKPNGPANVQRQLSLQGQMGQFTKASGAKSEQSTIAPSQAPMQIQREGEDQPQKKSPWNKVRAGLKDIPTLMNPNSKEMMKTKQGTTWAARQKKKSQMPDPSAYLSDSETSSHLAHFKTGGHAFVTPEKHALIHKGSGRGGYGGWGLDSNFISPLSEADELTQDAHQNQGIYTLEERLGIPHGVPWSWANPEKNPKNVMFRYKLLRPQNFGLRMPKGVEANAYAEEWEAGGVTLGGRREAVVNNLTLGDLIEAELKGELVVEQESFPETPAPASV